CWTTAASSSEEPAARRRASRTSQGPLTSRAASKSRSSRLGPRRQMPDKQGKFRTETVLLILVIAAFTSALWRYILGVPPFEEFWWAHLAPVGVMRPRSYELGITAASCVAWGLLAPY